MSRKEKQQELFKEFINYQLKPFDLTYESVKEDPQWYMKYSTTPDKESEFKDYIIERCREVLRLSKKEAENEASWFILQWGLTTNSNSSEKLIEEMKLKKKLK
jgi:hypothetical protein|tara:strand:- start:1786 stop:2094 length:309 start_codon:yes stop_codon:yes gene_type:complete